MLSGAGACGSIAVASVVDVEVEPLRLEILDQEGRLGERLALHVGIDADPPGAAHGVRGEVRPA